MSSAMPAAGPPSSVTIDKTVYAVARMGVCVPSTAITRDLIEKYGITWDQATWVVKKTGDAADPRYQFFPVIWQTRCDVVFLTSAIAAYIDANTALAADTTVEELNRTETLRIRVDGSEVTVPRIPAATALAPEGWKPAAKRPKATEPTECDAMTDDAPKKKKAKSGAGAAAPAASGSTCPWIIGRLKSTKSAFDSSVRWQEILSVSAAPKASVPKPAAPKASVPKPAPSKSKASNAQAMYKTVPPPAPPPRKPPPPPAKPAASRGTSAPAASDVIFTIREGRYVENVKEMLSYLAGGDDVPVEVRALVKAMVSAARKKPDETNHVFAKSGLPMRKWTVEDLQSIDDKDLKEEVRGDFVAVRSVFAALLAKPKRAAANSEW